MIRIGICDDEKIILEMLGKIISTCLEELGVEAELALFHNGRELLEAGMELKLGRSYGNREGLAKSL